jgi:hypothetical protein
LDSTGNAVTVPTNPYEIKTVKVQFDREEWTPERGRDH